MVLQQYTGAKTFCEIEMHVAVFAALMSTHASILIDSVGPPSAEVCRTAASFS
jgi:hypothetical protein